MSYQPTSVFDPLTILKAIDLTPRPRTFLREFLLRKAPETFPTEIVLLDVVKGRRRLAPFVGPRGKGRTMQREAYKTEKYTPPLVIPRDVITPDRLMIRQPGESLVSGRTPAERALDEQAAILNSFDLAITRREEWMLSQLLTTGQIPIVGEGVDDVYDVSFTNTSTLVGANCFDQGADIIAQLETWQLQCLQLSGIKPNLCIVPSDTAAAMLRNDTFLKQVSKLYIQLGTIQPRDLPSGATYLGTIDKLGLDLYQYMEWSVDETTGNLVQLIPAGTCTLAPSWDRNPGARMLYGAWTEIKTMTTYEGTRIPREWIDEDDNVLVTELVSRPLPTLIDSNCWYTANVLSA